MDKSKLRTKLNLLCTLVLFTLGVLTTFLNTPNAVSAFASNDYTPVVTLENKTVNRGQTFNIDVELSDNEGLLSLYLSLNYNNSVMKLLNVKQGEALSSLTYTNVNPDTDMGYAILPFNMLWDGRVSDNSNGKLISLTFESYSDAEVGVYPVTLTYDPNNTNKEYGEPIEISIVNSSVNLIKGEYEAIYYDWDDTVLYQKDYNADDIPSYEGELPSRETDECYSYEFVGWKGKVSEDVAIVKYQADYKLTPIIYNIFYYVDGLNEETFDGRVDDDDFYEAKEIAYGTFLENAYPLKARYVFSGWFLDKECMKPFTLSFMPAYSISLYGYFVYDIRTTSIPKIELSATEVENDQVSVNANMVVNTGFNGMVLTLDYDRNALEFIGFEKQDVFSLLQFDTTNVDTEKGYSVENFTFYYEHTENTYETGLFLKLNFKIKASTNPGVYHVTFKLGNTDATYLNGSNGTRYTMIEIIEARIPVGKIYRWDKNTDDDALITILSEKGMPADTVLVASLVPESKHQISNETVKQVAGEDMKLKAVYSLKLVRMVDNVEMEVQPDSELTVEITLTATQQACKKVSIYYVSDIAEMSVHDSERDGEKLRFKTDHLSLWAVVGNEIVVSGTMPSTMILLITLLILLAIATMAYTLIIIGKNRKKKGELKE